MNEQPVTQQELDRLHTAWEQAPESRSFAPLADAYHRAGRHEEAIELLHSGTTRHPDYLSALVLLADCYQALQRTEEASTLYARVLSQDEENIRALEHQAEQSIRQGALGKAAALVEKLRKIDPWDANIRRLSAQLQQAPKAPRPRGVDAAAAGYPAPMRLPGSEQPDASAVAPPSQAVSPAPTTTPTASDELSTLTLAQIYESQGYLQKALTIYERLLQQHPGNEQVGQRLEELRRRLTGVDDSAQSSGVEPMSAAGFEGNRLIDPPTVDTERAAPPGSGWRLVDEHSLGELRPARPVSGGPPADNNAASANAAASRDEDFQRFLRYVRSLGR